MKQNIKNCEFIRTTNGYEWPSSSLTIKEI